MRSAWATGLVVICGWLALPPVARSDESPWSITAQGGGSLGFAQVRHYVDGRRVQNDGNGDDAYFLIDTRASLARAFGRWFALAGQLSLTNWQSEYRRQAGYRRNNFVALALSPELRLPLGRCLRCPVLYAAPRLGLVGSQRDQRAPHAAVKEDGRFGTGMVAGGRLGLQLRIHRRLAMGLKLETGFDKTWLRHEVELSGVGQETQRFVLVRPVNLVGFWWTP